MSSDGAGASIKNIFFLSSKNQLATVNLYSGLCAILLRMFLDIKICSIFIFLPSNQTNLCNIITKGKLAKRVKWRCTIKALMQPRQKPPVIYFRCQMQPCPLMIPSHFSTGQTCITLFIIGAGAGAGAGAEEGNRLFLRVFLLHPLIDNPLPSLADPFPPSIQSVAIRRGRSSSGR